MPLFLRKGGILLPQLYFGIRHNLPVRLVVWHIQRTHPFRSPPKMRLRLYLFLLTLAIIPCGLTAQTVVNSPITWTTYNINSQALNAIREYYVSVPQNYQV